MRRGKRCRRVDDEEVKVGGAIEMSVKSSVKGGEGELPMEKCIRKSENPGEVRKSNRQEILEKENEYTPRECHV